MGVIYKKFKKQTFELWNLAHQLKKPKREDVAWCTGIVQGRSDFKDLQTQVMALASSIIINEPTVPEIIIAWDSPQPFKHWKEGFRGTGFPEVIKDCINPKEPLVSHFHGDRFGYNKMDTKYVTVRRAWLSINGWCPGLGRGYRAKWGGLRYCIAPYGILSDADTICMEPCVDYLMSGPKKDPETFCWTTWIEPDKINVGLCVFNMVRLNAAFFPLLSRIWWGIDKKDSTFVQAVRRCVQNPDEHFRLGLMDKRKVNSERFAAAKKYGKKAWSEDTMHYHAWKREVSQGGDKFVKLYGSILDQLKDKAQEQLKKG